MSKHKVKLIAPYDKHQTGDTIEIELSQFPYMRGMGFIDPKTKVPGSSKSAPQAGNIDVADALVIKSKPSKANP